MKRLHPIAFFFLFFSFSTALLQAQVEKPVPQTVPGSPKIIRKPTSPSPSAPGRPTDAAGKPINTRPNTTPGIDRSTFNIAPFPRNVIPKAGEFVVAADVIVVGNTKDKETNRLMELVANRFFSLQGFKMKVQDYMTGLPEKRYIYFEPLANGPLGKEGYQISVQTDKIIIRANTHVGYFYAIQTIFQMLPPELYAYRKMEKSVVWRIQNCDIEDKPELSYRGMHLDVSRHFFTPQEVKMYIDLLAMHKFNYFHWHLTDDQGWRVEIKKYPLLTKVGGTRKETIIGKPGQGTPDKFDGKPVTGYYTQLEINDIVAYAAERFVTIVPEIDVPGHSQAAIAAYPFLACNKKPAEVWTNWGVTDGVMCPNDSTLQFLYDVFDEIMTMFPGQYIHIGGDEVPSKPWLESPEALAMMEKLGKPKDTHALQDAFNVKLAEYIHNKGRRIIGWDEILDSGQAPEDALVMSWRGTQGGITAANQGHEVIMCPGTHCYFDHYQADPSLEPLAIGGYTPIDKVYAYQAIPTGLDPSKYPYVIGAQANLWTEYITDFNHLTYMAFPRAIALSEALWLPIQKRDYAQFQNRMSHHLNRLENMNINYSKHIFDPIFLIKRSTDGANTQLFCTNDKNIKGALRITTTGEPLNPLSPLYTGTINIDAPTRIRAAYYNKSNKQISSEVDFLIEPNLVSGTNPKISARAASGYQNINTISDGRRNTISWLQKGWTGFSDTTFTLTYDLSNRPFDTVSIGFAVNPWDNILLPASIKLESSNDGINYETLTEKNIAPLKDYRDWSRDEITITLKKESKAKFLRIECTKALPCPEGSPCANKKSTILIDEIIVH